MRRVLLVLVATAGLAATMALPASAAVVAGPGHGGPGAAAPHPGQGPGPVAPHPGEGPGPVAPHPGGPGSFEPGRPGGGPGGHDHDPHFGGGPYYGGPYYGGPYYGGPYSSACPGYYDGDGRYWSWDPASQTFQPCPDGVVCCS